MSSAGCCLSRHPPSPDGVGPRPALASPPIFNLNNESQEFFPARTSGSRLSKPEDAATIQAIYGEEKSSVDDERQKTVSKTPLSALGAVKARVKKTVSKDSELTKSKRHVRTSVGTSEEEIERRAELRRIRHKRIQEELSQEGGYDEDASSLSVVNAPLTPSISGLQKRASWAPGNPHSRPDFSLPALAPPDSPPSKIALPPAAIFNQKGSMLEALYYGLANPQTAATNMCTDAYSTEWSSSMVNFGTTSPRRHSLPATLTPNEKHELGGHRPAKKCSFQPQMPAAPVIQPQRLPSFADCGKSSWRLSFSTENRGDQLRQLSQGVNLPALLNPEKLVGGPQSMETWLHSQGLRTMPHEAQHSEDASNLECSASHFQTGPSTQDFGGVDGGDDLSATLHLHEMGISQRLASRGLHSSCSSPQLLHVGRRSHERDVSSLSGISRATYKSCARRCQNTTDSIPLSERIPETWGNILENGNPTQDATSSFYPSANNSIQPSRKSSRFSLFRALPGTKSNTDFTELKRKSILSLDKLHGMESPSIFVSPTSSRTPLSRHCIPSASASSDSLPLPFVVYHRRPTIDTNSTAISETESFRQREAELSVVQTRFAAAEASRTPSTPRSSKFREEFHFTAKFMETPLPSRPSAFSRLTRFAARSFDGAFERKQGIPMNNLTPVSEPDELHHHHSKHAKGRLNPVPSPLEDNSVLGMWGNAVKLHGDNKTKDVASTKGSPSWRTGSFRGLKEKGHVSTGKTEKATKKFALKGLGGGWDDEGSESDSEEKPEDDWDAELAKAAQRAKGKSRNIVKNPTGPDRRYPWSWSKFPSHDRHERTSSAEAKDRVQVKDFATEGSELLDNGKKTLREQIQKRLIAEHNKRTTAEVMNATETTFGRRSSIRLGGGLEYPELEILPLQTVSLMSHEQIAEHVEEVLEEEELDRKEEELNAIFGLAEKAAPKLDDRTGMTKLSSGNNTPGSSSTTKGSERSSRTGTAAAVKGSGKSSRTGTGAAVATESKPLSAPSNMPVKKDLTTRRGPVARKLGEGLPMPKLPRKIAPAVLPTRNGWFAKAVSPIDESVHGESEFFVGQIGGCKVDDGEISTADPRFYEDCIVNTTPHPEIEPYRCEHEGSDDVTSKVSKSSKHGTWNGRDCDNCRLSAKNRRSLGALKLTESEDEILNELKKAEVAEREKALRAAEEAWGG